MWFENRDAVKVEDRGRDLVAVAQVAVALPAAGTGAAEAGGGLGRRRLGARRAVALLLPADELGFGRGALPHLPQAGGEARRHGDTAAAANCG